jgi:hypothetical protein
MDGASIFTSATGIDAVDADIGMFTLYITFRTIGATGTAVVHGFYSNIDASGTQISNGGHIYYEDASINTTTDIVLDVTGTWSAANAANDLVLNTLIVKKL